MTEYSAIVCETADHVLSVESGDSIPNADIAWKGALEAGLHRLLVSETHGGLGDDFETAAAVASRYGAHAASIPLLDTIVCNWAFAHAGLPITDAPAVLVPGTFIEAQVSGDRTISWKRHFHVPMIVGTPKILIALEAPGGPSVAVLESLRPNAMTTSLAGEPCGRISACSAVRTLDIARLPSGLPSLVDLGALLKAAAIAGALEKILELTLSYANSRIQFGRPIGQFQAVQHMITRISSETVAASVAIREAARIFSSARGPFAVATAKAFASEIAGSLPSLAHQVHGAIGYCEEFVLHRLSRRIWSWREQMGDEIYWQEALGSLILDHCGDLWHVLTDGERLTANGPGSNDVDL
jgi:acyl-CoA dehydrogenase